MMKPTVSLLLVACVASCATMYNRMIGVSDNTAKTAIAQKDYPKLQKICTGEVNTPSANTREDTCDAAFDIALEKRDIAWMRPLCHRTGELFGGRFGKACVNTLKLAAADNDLASMHELCDRDKVDAACREIGRRETFGDLDHPDCAKLPAQFEKARSSFLASDKAEPEELAKPVMALVTCGHADTLFETIVHIGWERGAGAFGTRVLMAMDKLDGKALFAAYQGYIKSHAGRGLFGAKFQSFAANHVGSWLNQAGHHDECEPLVAAAANASSAAQYGLLDYMVAMKCTAGAPILAGLLSDTDADVREDVCEALGQVGTASELPKLRILAETDRSNRVVERPEGSGIFVKDYFVQDACSSAVGQIGLRGSSARHGRG